MSLDAVQIRARIVDDHPSIMGPDGSHLSGDEYEALIDEWVSEVIASTLSTIRNIRNGLLSACDWTQIPDASVDAKAWRSYRQALRDLPATITDPTQPIEWPEPPK
jgi:hypothetical protein